MLEKQRISTICHQDSSVTSRHGLHKTSEGGAVVSGTCPSEAQELTIVKMSKFGGGIGAPSKEERLKAAAEIHLRLGQIQRYCELMVELGEKALSVAPGVSMKYWKKLMQRRADQLMQEGNDDVIPYCIATGDVKKLVSFFTSRGQLKEALLVAQGACEGNIHGPAITSINHSASIDNDSIEIYTGDLAARLLQMIPDNETLLAKLCAFSPGSSAERNDLHDKLFRRDPEAFPGQPKDIVSPTCPGSSPEPLPGGACPEHLSRETSRRHPKQMPEPPQLPPFDVEEQRLYSELLPGD
ncbi:hypothetical protein QTP70_007596 [Hemibagrus guttatus]|uniref:Uncharacterized protein n=1 Tax=Hemibagrus guttatus TaxID=175788 RepID=A0AAE0RHT7_9TELE|nr:hypothetical protein QTP70_007596 [Hemibagrus guttatus]